ncbi:ferredoxin--NADP reductase [Acinetobacter qingfengensis]|uniref:ferredoxin--NADP(+) reductase n=1 Tax=Acinetobacter qingfengensis TaxID=1262585 RepID=A0A1E7RE81_9GAMM|nr:ferredoxin--NADP reductase [Acinetobacter qingfengensis]KAA8734755.1 ferredoxin--NADP reductase [Acinetobacter qingfengensis]OEY97674.1 ferredoxin--NADP(+) reductase [Acinetobacter qingfengensis]
MAAFNVEKIIDVHHWNDTLFSFKTTRDQSLRFKNGQFVMIGLEVNGKPLMRAYSIASANYEDHLEFFSIKVPDGPLTSILQKVKVGDDILISKKPTGTLVHDDLNPGKNLYFLSSGTGLAPFLSLIRDPETYEKFDKVILVHGTRWISELAYQDLILNELPNNEWFEELDIKNKLIYYPTVTREPFRNEGRVTTAIETGQIFEKIGLPPFNPETDRAMLCGSPHFLTDVAALLDKAGLKESPRMGVLGDYVIERAFVEK